MSNDSTLHATSSTSVGNIKISQPMNAFYEKCSSTQLSKVLEKRTTIIAPKIFPDAPLPVTITRDPLGNVTINRLKSVRDMQPIKAAAIQKTETGQTVLSLNNVQYQLRNVTKQPRNVNSTNATISYTISDPVNANSTIVCIIY